MTSFAAVDVIRTKRDRGRIPDEQIDWVIDAYTRGTVAEEQMAALAMAILLNGMQPVECLSAVGRVTLDRSSVVPDAIMAAVQRASSPGCIPLSRMAIASAAICSSATVPRV